MDIRIKTRFLFSLLLIFAFNYNIICLKMLLIGDSNDRAITSDWFAAERMQYSTKGLKTCKMWIEVDPRFSNFYCTNGEHSLANIFIFGSRDRATSYDSNKKMLTHYTKDILPMLIDKYFASFGAPDIVFFQSCLWDAAYFNDLMQKRDNPSQSEELHVSSKAWNNAMTEYTANIKQRIRDVQAGIQRNTKALNVTHHINLGLHTAVYKPAMEPIILDMNKVLVQVAREQNLSLYDFDNDVWSIHHGDYSHHEVVFRDHRHPREEYTLMAGAKLLGTRYSSSLLIRGAINSDTLLPKLCLFDAQLTTTSSKYACDDLHKRYPQYIQKVFLVSVSHSSLVYYLHYHYYNASLSIQRLGPLSLDNLPHLNLSPLDILYLSKEELHSIPLSDIYRIPLISNASSVYHLFNTTTGQLYLYSTQTHRARLYNIPIEHLKYYGFMVCPSKCKNAAMWTYPNITQHVPSILLTQFIEGSPVPNIFDDGEVFSYDKRGEFFMFIDGQKRSVSTKLLHKFGKHVGQVKTVEKVDVDGIPTGPPIIDEDKGTKLMKSASATSPAVSDTVNHRDRDDSHEVAVTKRPIVVSTSTSSTNKKHLRPLALSSRVKSKQEVRV